MPAQRPLPDRIADLKSQKERLAAKLIALEAKAKQEDRRRDTHRKIVVGATVLAAIETDAALAAQLRALLHAGVERPADREVIGDLLGGALNDGAKAAAAPASPMPEPAKASD